MKKIGLILAALGLISSAVLAGENQLEIKKIGQELEINNTSGGEDIGEKVKFSTSVELSYQDWIFGIEGKKEWKMDTVAGIKSRKSKFELEAIKSVNENLELGVKFEGESDKDNYGFTYEYAKDFFISEGEFTYSAVNTGKKEERDEFEIEAEPLGFKYKDLKITWYIDYVKVLGEIPQNSEKYKLENQIRVYWDFYKSSKLDLSAEYRIGLNNKIKFSGNKIDVDEDEVKYKDFGMNAIYLSADYSVTKNLTIYGEYGYEIYNWQYINSGKTCNSEKYYEELTLGWKYKF